MNEQNEHIEQSELSKLVAKSRNGNRNAQEQLIRAVQDQVYFHCRKILKNQEDALDATQDVLISMFKNLKNLREPDAFPKWLATITCRVCLRYLERRKRDLALLVKPGEDPDFADFVENERQSVPEEALDNAETRRIVRELVDELPPEQSMCVLLYYYDELPVKDIASALAVSEGTVKSRLFYARKNIKKGLDKYDGVPFYSPVPFLRYFLRREASGLTVSAAKAMSDAVLAATAAAAVPKGVIAAAVAGVALAGVIAAGVLPGRNIADTPVTPAAPPDDARPPVVDVQIPDGPAMPAPAPVGNAVPDAPAPQIQPQIQRLTVSLPAPDPVPVPDAPVAPVMPETEPDAPAPDTVLIVVNDTPVVPVPVSTPVSIPSPTEIAPPNVFVQPAVPTPEPAPSQPESPPSSSDTYDPYEPYEPVPVVPDMPEPEEPTVISQELAEFGYNSGYGYTSNFTEKWDGELPENLVFSSSDPSIIYIREDGEFSTLAPGQAVLTAEDPDNPNLRYALTMEVQDRYNWSYNLMKVSLKAGGTDTGGFASYGIYLGDSVNHVEWTSGDSSIVEISPVPNPTSCRLHGLAPGETDICGLVFLTRNTVAGLRDMQDKVSFHVTVAEPEKKPDTITKDNVSETENETVTGEEPSEPENEPVSEENPSEPESKSESVTDETVPESESESENVTGTDTGENVQEDSKIQTDENQENQQV